MVLGGISTNPGIMIKKGFRLFDACKRKVVRLYPIAVVLGYAQVKARGTEHAYDNNREDSDAPEQADKNGC